MEDTLVHCTSLCSAWAMCEPQVVLLDHCPYRPCVSSPMQHHLPVPQLHKPGAAREPEPWVYSVGLSSWGIASGRATCSDKIHSVLIRSLRRTESHNVVCKQDICKQDLWGKEGEICVIPCTQLQTQLMLTFTQSLKPGPARDATYCACMSVAWYYTPGRKKVQRLHSDLKIFETQIWFLATRPAGINRLFIQIFSNNTFKWKIFWHLPSNLNTVNINCREFVFISLFILSCMFLLQFILISSRCLKCPRND